MTARNFAILWFAAALVLLAVSYWPPARQQLVLTLAQVNSAGELDSYSLPPESQWRIDSPTVLRNGERVPLRLVFEPGPMAGSPSAAMDAVVMEARLEWPGYFIQPAGIISAPLGSGSPTEFSWQITGSGPAPADGILWVYLSRPLTGQDPQRDLILARSLPLKFVPLAGIPLLVLRFLAWASLGLAAGLTAWWRRKIRAG